MADKIEQNIREIASRYSGQSMKRICRRLPMQNAVSLVRKIGANVLAIHRKIILMAVAQLHVVRK